MTKVIYIDCVPKELELEEFSLAAILDADDIDEIHRAREDEFLSSAANVSVSDVVDKTIVTLYDYDGVATHYIGSDFTGPRDI